LSCNLLFKNVRIKIHKTKNFACGFVWVWNSVSDIKDRTQTEVFWESADNIRTQRRMN
jgi:hypothetical protein